MKRGINALIGIAFGKADYQRWGNRYDLLRDWDSRTQKSANLIKPGTSIIEFGAGRLVLSTFLPPSCSYTPSDLVDRGSETIICDLNSDLLPQFKLYDVAVFSGVLEYIEDVPRLIFHLSNCAIVIIASYAVSDFNRQSNRYDQGWINNYSIVQFIDIFESAGFLCDYTELWRSQVIFKFTIKSYDK